MAQDSEPPKSVDKGKGKAVEGEASKNKDVKKDKDGKPLVNGKVEEPVVGGMLKLYRHDQHHTDHFVAGEDLSEEDQQLKSELDMLVERLSVCHLPPLSHDVSS